VHERLHGLTLWSWLAAHPEEEAIFNASMGHVGPPCRSRRYEPPMTFSGASVVVDVGGGQGAMLALLLTREPSLRGIVADRPEVAAAATAHFAEAGLGVRARGEPADFFASMPTGGDVCVVSNVLHDWHDAEALSVLRAVPTAMRSDARLLVETCSTHPGERRRSSSASTSSTCTCW
jgi:hypothetical protein